jgi:hypothetical protein
MLPTFGFDLPCPVCRGTRLLRLRLGRLAKKLCAIRQRFWTLCSGVIVLRFTGAGFSI